MPCRRNKMAVRIDMHINKHRCKNSVVCYHLKGRRHCVRRQFRVKKSTSSQFTILENPIIMKVGPILRDIREREIGISGNNILRYNHKLLRKLVCQENITYKKRLKFDNVKSRIYYEKSRIIVLSLRYQIYVNFFLVLLNDIPIIIFYPHLVSGKIYYENYRQCIITCGFQGDPQIAYNIPSVEQPEKIVDCIFCHSPSILTKKCPNYDSYRSSLLALTEKNRLLRLDSETGKVLQSINLSNRNRFRHISWETAVHSVVLKSIFHFGRNINGQIRPGAGLPSCETRRFAFIVFDVLPLQFRVHFEIRLQVFPDGVRDAQVLDGLLILESSRRCGTVYIYSLQDVLIDKKISDSVSGDPNNGLPINVVITEPPPLLLTVNCVGDDLAFDGYPWLYISRIRSQDSFQVCTVEPHRIVGNGLLEYPSNRIEPEGAVFHEDNSGRIIHYSATEFRVLKLFSSNDNETRELRTDYGISFDKTESKEPTIQFTSFGRRRSTRKARLDSVSTEAYKHSLISFHYEDELDMLTMLIAEPSSYDSSTVHGSVRMYDNATGKLIKRFKLDHEWEEDDEHTFVLDCDVLIHIINRPRLCNRCYLYKLIRTDDYDTEAPVVIKKHIKNAFSTTYIF